MLLVDHLSCDADGFVGHRQTVGPHVGDKANGFALDLAALIEILGEAHCVGSAKAQLARGFLLQRRGREGGGRMAPDLLAFDREDLVAPTLPDDLLCTLGSTFIAKRKPFDLLAFKLDEASAKLGL